MVFHLFLSVVGFSNLMAILALFQTKPSRKYTLHGKEEVLLLKKTIHPIFRRIRSAKWTWSNCFSSSILLWYILNKHGLSTQLLIGVDKASETFQAHAWIEFAALPLNEYLNVRDRHYLFDYNFIKNNMKHEKKVF